MEQNINADHNNDILLIFAVLRGITRRWTTTSEIQNRLASQGLDIHRRTLQRVLKRIVLDDRTRVYAYRQTVPSGSFSAMQMNPQECLLLRLFEENMRYLLPGSLMNAMEPLFETARATLRERAPETPERTWLSKVASVPSGVKFIPPEIKPRIFDAVSEALYREVKLEVRYRNLEGVEKEAIVSPLGLVLQDRKVYVVVRFDGYDNCRHLALHRMLDAKLLEFAADVPEDFSLDEYMQSRHFNYSNGKKVRLDAVGRIALLARPEARKTRGRLLAPRSDDRRHESAQGLDRRLARRALPARRKNPHGLRDLSAGNGSAIPLR